MSINRCLQPCYLHQTHRLDFISNLGPNTNGSEVFACQSLSWRDWERERGNTAFSKNRSAINYDAISCWPNLFSYFVLFSPDAASRKKSKKKRKKLRDIERSSGDSDNQLSNDEIVRRTHILNNDKGESDNSQSGMEADSESQGSRDFKKLVGEGKEEGGDGDGEGSGAQVIV